MSRTISSLGARSRLGRSSIVVLTMVLLTVGFAFGSTQSASAARAVSAGYPAMSTSGYEKRVQRWVNAERKQHGLHRLRVASCTDRVAERWNAHLATNDLFYHQSMQRILNRCDAWYAGETLGRGAITPKVLVQMWMDSPGHRVVLMSPKSNRIGIAAQPDAYGRWVTTADFMRL